MAGFPPLRQAATIVVLRPGPPPGGVEILMVRRHGRSGFAADAWVFPGGVVDEADRALPADCWRGIDPDGLSDRFRARGDVVLGLHVAAVRETFEEAGLLLASDQDGESVDLTDPDVIGMRRSLAARDDPAGAKEFSRWLHERGFVLELGQLEYWSHWITPRIEAKRYDTRFFLASAPLGQVAEHDRVEITGQAWVSPQRALEEAESGRMEMIYPTIKNLEEMAASGQGDVGGLMAYATKRERVPTILPHFERLADGEWRILHPDDPEFPHEDYREELA